MAGRGAARRGGAGQGAARYGKARFISWLREERVMLEKVKKTDDVVKTTRFTDIITRKVTLAGLTDIMFDRYPGDNNTKLEPHQMLYLAPGNSKVIGIPNLNLMSFLSAHNTNSAPKRLRDKRKFKDIANAMLSFVVIKEAFIPFLRDGKPIQFGKFDHDKDEKSGCYVRRDVARLDKGVPNPKVRPVLPLPWELQFTLELFPNREIKEVDVLNLFEEGGRAIGLGTWRGVFGKFRIETWS